MLLSLQIARSLTPKSIPIPLFLGFSKISSTSIPTLIQKLIPSKVTLGFEYLQPVGILPFSANLTQFSFALFLLVDAVYPKSNYKQIDLHQSIEII